jgi:hypothetical protein
MGTSCPRWHAGLSVLCPAVVQGAQDTPSAVLIAKRIVAIADGLLEAPPAGMAEADLRDLAWAIAVQERAQDRHSPFASGLRTFAEEEIPRLERTLADAAAERLSYDRRAASSRGQRKGRRIGGSSANGARPRPAGSREAAPAPRRPSGLATHHGRTAALRSPCRLRRVGMATGGRRRAESWRHLARQTGRPWREPEASG